MFVEIISISLSLTVWLFLILFWGNFWRADCLIESDSEVINSYPTVCAIVPARDEAEVISTSVTSLLNQDYSGEFSIVLVDDNSSDRTGEIALATAERLGKSEQLTVISGKPLALGWKGKLWAMEQGIAEARSQTTRSERKPRPFRSPRRLGSPQAFMSDVAGYCSPDYFLLTDADIEHSTDNIRRLVAKAQSQKLDLVSLMVLLRCQSFWEKLLIPAFVFFFQKLYPFAWVNSPDKSLAAAAGGCILISNQALTEIGGIATIKDALIDDCSLAKAVKSRGKNIWLGLSETTTSLRGYDNLSVIWDTIARTAYTQLNYSPLLLFGTVIGMAIVYLATPIYLMIGIFAGNWLLITISMLTWLLMSCAYLPIIKLYKLSIAWAFCLPAIALLYTLMTIDSAIKYYRGEGGAWKGRTYK